MRGGTPRINRARFVRLFRELSSIGASGDGSVHRLALSQGHLEARRLLAEKLSSLGAEVYYDDAGNMYGFMGCGGEGVIALGSHLDSVPAGGRYDGAYGVTAGLEVLNIIQDQGLRLKHDLLLIDFMNEEGARFPRGMAGSAVATGLMGRDELYSLRDREGVSFREALENSGFLGSEEHRVVHRRPEAYVELHIEQGPLLHSSGLDIGVVEGVQGIAWLEVACRGRSNHAGTTPMRGRRDPLVFTAQLVKQLRDYAYKKRGLVVTVGRLEVEPNTINVIPGLCTAYIDVRSPSEEKLRRALLYVAGLLRRLSRREGITYRLRTLEMYRPKAFHPDVVRSVERVAGRLGLSHTRLYSGAGHDAQNMAAITRAGMIFIPSIGGVSHCRHERSTQRHMVYGADTLLNTVLDLDQRLSTR
jgi:N-carbamoyl-L-amino-acid hydrolase